MRWVYGLFGVIAVILLAIILWPGPVVIDQDRIITIDPQKTPKNFTLRAGGLTQAIAGDTDTVDGMARPIGARAISYLWQMVGELPVVATKVKDGVTIDQVGAYGLGDGNDLTAPDAKIHLRWALVGTTGYVWDGTINRLYVLPGSAATAVVRLINGAGRLDDKLLLANADRADRLEVGSDGKDTVVALGSGGWAYPLHEERPPCANRASYLLLALDKVPLDDLRGVPIAGLAPIFTVKMWMKKDNAAATLAPLGGMDTVADAFADHVVTGYSGADGSLIVAVDTLPAQTVPANVTAVLATAVGTMNEDILADVDADTLGLNTERIVIESHGQEWFSVLQRFEDRMHPTWELSWQGGRETASTDAVKRLLGDMTTLTVTAPKLDPAATSATESSAAPADGTDLRIHLVPKFGHDENVMTIIGDQAAYDGHRGKIAHMGEMLTQLAPEKLLDPRLFDQTPDRVTKFQREDTAVTPPLREVLAAGADGLWSRIWPEHGAVDAVAMARLLDALCGATATRISLLKPGAIPPGNPEFSLAVRFAPKEAALKEVETAMEETLAQERALAFYRSATGASAAGGKNAGGWQAWEIDRGMVWTLSDDLVAELRAPLASNLLLPMPSALVTRIEMDASTDGGRLFDLVRGAKGWQIGSAPADDLEVRRLLRALAELTIIDRQPKASPIVPGEAVLRITCTVPGDGDDNEKITLMIAKPADNSAELWASVESTRLTAVVPPGRCRIPDDALAALSASPARFIGDAAANAASASASASATAPATR